MLNKTRKLITGTALSLSAAVLLLLFTATLASGAARTSTAIGTTMVFSAGTLLDGALVSGSDTLVFAHAVTVTLDQDHTLEASQSTAALTTAGTTAIMTMDAGYTLIIEGTLVSSGGDFNINMGASGTVHTNTLIINGDTTSSQTDLAVLSPTSTTRISAITLGDGAGVTTSAMTMDLAGVAAGKVILTLNGAVVNGAVTDAAASGSLLVNVIHDSSITAAWNTADSNAANLMTITDAKTLTVGEDINLGALGKIVIGTSTAGGTIVTSAAKTITGLIDGPADGIGIIDIKHTTTLAGDVGTTNDIAKLEIEDVVATISGNISATTLLFAEDGTAAFAADKIMTGTVTATTSRHGTLTFAPTTTTSKTVASSTIGAAGTAIKAVTAGGAASGIGATFAAAIVAQTVTVTNSHADAFVAFGDDVTGAVVFGAAGTINIAANKKVVGSIDNGAAVGTINFAATTTNTTLVDGAVCTSNQCLLITAAPATGVTSSFGGVVKATTLTHSGAGTIDFAGVSTVTTLNITQDGTASWASGIVHTGAVTTGTTNQGTLSFTAGTQSVSGKIGLTGTRIKQITNVAGTLTLNEDVFATTTTINGTGITMGGSDLLTSAVYFDADGTLTTTDGVTGNITTETTQTGTVVTAAAGTITGSIGTSLLEVKLVDVDHTLAITEAVYAKDVSISGVVLSAAKSITASTKTHFAINNAASALALAAGANHTGIITTATDQIGIITVAGKSTISGNIGADNTEILTITIAGAGDLTLAGDAHVHTTAGITVASGGKLTFSNASAAAVTGKIVVTGTGTVDVGTATVTVTDGASAFPATSTLAVTIGTTNGKLVSVGSALGLNTDVVFVPTIKGTVTSGTALAVAVTNSGTIVVPGTITNNYERYTFALTTSAQSLMLTPTIVAPAGVSANSAAVSAIADVAFASDDTMAIAINGLSGTALDKALVSLAPTVDGGAIVGAVSAGAASGATISTQIASLRSGIAAGQGLNAGDGTAEEERVWTQGFGTYAEQEIRQKIGGFTSLTGGVALGVDKRFTDDLVLGLAYSYSHTDVDSSESQNETKVQGHQATLYGSHDFDKGIFGTDGVFLDGQLSYAYNDYEGERYIEVGAVSRRADSAYEGLQISTKFDLGQTIKLDDGFRFTPTAGLSYSHVSIDSYNETNAAASNLQLQEQDYDVLNLNLKGRIARTWQVDGIDLTPEVHLGYSYEAIHDKIQAISTFQGGGNAFTSTGFSPANNTFLGGIGVTWGGDSMPVDVTLTYDATHKEDFLSHSGLVKGVWRF